MQTIIGRLTADAKVKEVTEGRTVVNFTVAKNERYKTKGSDKAKEVVKYYDCSYWLGTGISAYLKKGTLVEINGEINANAWIDKDGNARAGLTMHVNKIDLHGSTKGDQKTNFVETKVETEPADDLPF